MTEYDEFKNRYSDSNSRLIRVEACLVQFRRDLCQVLFENGIMTNPGWSENDIVRAFRDLTKKS